jgi:hypothetical protein
VHRCRAAASDFDFDVAERVGHEVGESGHGDRLAEARLDRRHLERLGLSASQADQECGGCRQCLLFHVSSSVC